MTTPTSTTAGEGASSTHAAAGTVRLIEIMRMPLARELARMRTLMPAVTIFRMPKLERSGGTLTLVDPRNTSRTCNACGHVAAENRESQAVFICVSCGHTAHADVNAAINIQNRAFGAGTGGPPGMACGSNRTGGRKQECPAISLAA